MRKNLKTVFDYFSYFSYAPSFSEIHTFFPIIISKKHLQTMLTAAYKRNKLVRLPNNTSFGPFSGSTNHYPLATSHSRYTLPQYSTPQGNKSKSEIKIQIKRSVWIIQTYILLLKLLPLVRFVGITGKSAMEGIRSNDDVDLFIVSKAGWIWTTRFICVVLAKILGIYHKTGVCLNLFFDESDLVIPVKKQNSYIAHELLQMKPIFDKSSVYSLLIQANAWIYSYFPNAMKPKSNILKLNAETQNNTLESILKSLQLPIIRRNKTSLFITNTQLWLFRSDFEKKLKRNGLGR